MALSTAFGKGAWAIWDVARYFAGVVCHFRTTVIHPCLPAVVSQG